MVSSPNHRSIVFSHEPGVGVRCMGLYLDPPQRAVVLYVDEKFWIV